MAERNTAAWRPAVAYLVVVLVPAAAALSMLLLGPRSSGPAEQAPSSTPSLIGLMLVTLPVVLATAHLCGAVMHRLGQPRVMGEMIGGLLLGPSVLGALSPAAEEALFPPPILPLIDALAQLGVVFFMFRVGVELNTRLLRENGAAAVVVGHGALVVPFVLGIGLGLALPAAYHPNGVDRLPFLFFLGLSLSVSALPVLAAILRQRRMLDTPIGTLGIAAAGVGDATVWFMLTVLLVLTGQGDLTGVARTAVLIVAMAAAMVAVARPLRLALEFVERRGRDRYPMLAFLTLFVLLCALAGDLIGIHPILGAFAAGVVMPRSSTTVHDFVRRSEGLTLWLLLPLFFASIGLRTHLDALDGVGSLAILGVVLVVAAAGKFTGGALAGRLLGLPGKESAALGVMLNCRGLTELVMLNLGHSLRLVPDSLFTILVLTTVITTLATAPLLGLLRLPTDGETPREPATRDSKAAATA